MSTITIKTQAELDALPDSFSEFTYIHIVGGDVYNPIVVRKARESSHVVARGSSHVVARESSHVVARESSHVEAWGSSHVEARGSSHVEAWESSHVEAWGSSHVVARESSHVEAWGSSHVVARESSHVEAWGSSHVEAWGSSHVVARESSHVEARGSVSVHNHSVYSTLELGGFAVAMLIAKAKTIKRLSKTVTTIEPKRAKGLDGWLEADGVKATRGKVILYKRVSSEWKTQEKTSNETDWTPGKTVEHANWDPKSEECGPGKFHACSRGYFCDEFREIRGDRYVAIEVATKDMHAWESPIYPHKIAFRKGLVLHECNKFGVKVEAVAT